MARRRLSPTIPAGPLPAAPEAGAALSPADVPRAERFPGAELERKSAFPPPRGAGAPIARVAAEAAGQAALDEVVETLRRAEAEGRMVIEIPLGDIAADHLARDRVAPDAFDADEEMAALRASLRAHGQRMPIEVTPLEGPAPGTPPYGLISGWRRLAALAALHAETGAARFATVKALVRRPETLADAYVAMVEENEIRLGLSQYERARVAALATDRGIFPDEGAALRTLFATASRAKRSRIRAFIEIYRALDRALRFPAHLPERLGLRVVEQIRAGHGGPFAAALALARPRTPEGELLVIEAAVGRFEAWERDRAAKARAAAETPEAPAGAGTGKEEERAGVEKAGLEKAGEAGWRWERLGAELEFGIRDGARPELRLRGRGVTPELTARLRAALG